MSRMTLLALQVLVAIVCLVLWQLLSTVPVFGKILLPPFFFSNPVDVFAQIVKWFSSGVIWKHLGITLTESVLAFVIGSAGGVLKIYAAAETNPTLLPYLLVPVPAPLLVPVL